MNLTVAEKKALRQREGTYCELCNEPVAPTAPLLGCEKCCRLYGPCCNSCDTDRCVECVE